MSLSSAALTAHHVAITDLARRHGLALAGKLDINELGLDFQVVTAKDEQGTLWVLRIPRRPDVVPKIDKESKTLSFLKQRLPFAVPDWQIVTSELVAYPRLTDTTAMTLDSSTMVPTWHIDTKSPAFSVSLAGALAAMHNIPVADAKAAGFKFSTPQDARASFLKDLDLVKREIGVASHLEHQWRAWLDDDSLWPDFTTVVHGDLYVGHILVDGNDRVTGMIDWTEAEISDPAIDFSGHLAALGSEGLDTLIAAYEEAGGRTWPKMRSHIASRLAAFPVKYGVFALASGDRKHLEAAKAQLGVGG